MRDFVIEGFSLVLRKLALFICLILGDKAITL